MELVCRAVGTGAIFCAIPTTLAMCYFLFATTANVRPEKRRLMHLVAPVSMFLPHLYTDVGNRYRKRFLFSVLVFALLFSIVALCKSLLP